MPRITDLEKQCFHNLLDSSIGKLENPKNIKKIHWSELSLTTLNKMLRIESDELDLAIHEKDLLGIITECDDIINFAMFIKHNICMNKESF